MSTHSNQEIQGKQSEKQNLNSIEGKHTNGMQQNRMTSTVKFWVSLKYVHVEHRK